MSLEDETAGSSHQESVEAVCRHERGCQRCVFRG